MNIDSGNSFSIAQQGLQRSKASAVEAAQQIANTTSAPEQLQSSENSIRLDSNAPVDSAGAVVSEGSFEASSGSLVEPLVQLKESQQLFDASAKVIAVSSQTVGALLDVSA